MEENKMATKQEIENIAEEVLMLLKTKELPCWQCKEVLRYTKDKLDKIIVR